jgi:hypothetical protein
MMRLFEIYLNDLNDEAKENYLDFRGVKDPAELNADIAPVCVIERSDDDETDVKGD